MTKRHDIYIFVSGGCVTQVTDAFGKEVGAARLIDYDNEQAGACPVCGTETEVSEGSHVPECSECGYNYSRDHDNALECAVMYHAADNEALNG